MGIRGLLGLWVLVWIPLGAGAHAPKAHRHIAVQGIDLWLASRWSFDPARREVAAYREQVENGAVEEDFMGTLPFLEHSLLAGNPSRVPVALGGWRRGWSPRRGASGLAPTATEAKRGGGMNEG